ncbi:toprim domain-containing protein [Paenibacillus pinihumi]|uniref:toprim domain-containing protein n=1 Tax=Paenibacillus pinihumi TaxID=669462 RepID=UPI0004069330|nr:toprim domain-containing protein [Paenibacillus pinihumi]
MNVDVRAELEAYEWHRATWTASYLLACSPFRRDDDPSFYIYYEDTATARAGYWGDRGTGETGALTELIARLNGIGYDEAGEYLRLKYGEDESGSDLPALRIPKLSTEATVFKPLDISILDPFKFRSPYLGGRKISEAVQRLCRIGYDKSRKAVTIPIFSGDGTLANVKYRRVDTKLFWYERGGRPIRELLFGLDVIYRRECKRAVIVEAEIDAMTVMTAGFPAVATMGSAFNRYKADLIRRSPVEELIVIRDNDAAGRKWQRAIIEELRGDVKVSVATVNSRYKDVNKAATESSVDQVARYVIRRHTLREIKIMLGA